MENKASEVMHGMAEVCKPTYHIVHSQVNCGFALAQFINSVAEAIKDLMDRGKDAESL
jgi:hypothetical protein